MQRAGIIKIIGRYFAGDSPSPSGSEIAKQNFVVGIAGKIFFVIEKMQRLITEQRRSFTESSPEDDVTEDDVTAEIPIIEEPPQRG